MAGAKVHQLEKKADALARDLGRGCGHGEHHDGCGHSALDPKPQIQVSKPTDPAERLADRAADAMDAGMRVADGIASRATRPAGPVVDALRPAGLGRPLSSELRQSAEASLGSDLSDVRVHDDHRADALSRHLEADGFAVGRHVYFRQGVYGSSSPRDRHVVNHELAHAAGGGGENDGVIERHASWEHRMLGDVDPKVLEVIAAGRDLVQAKKDNPATKVPTKTIQGVDEKGAKRTIDGKDVLHALEQEIERQRAFAKMKPEKRLEGKTGKNEVVVKKDGAVDSRWEVHIVNIPLRDGSVAALTYGEMNTLGDFYGSPEEISQTDPQQFVNYLYGIREEGIRKFMSLHTEIAKGLGEKTKYDGGKSKHKVKDEAGKSQGNTGTGDVWGELKLMGAGITKKEAKKLAKNETGEEVANTGYTGGLARNACHFAPQSWHAWSAYHQKGKALAGEAWTKREAAKASKDPAAATKLNEEADKKQNEALVQNGFGDHFLQDSYAAGHLINKTLIMQWFVKWMDEHPEKRDYTKDAKWQRIQNIAYGQSDIAAKGLYTAPLKVGKASDAQSVDNMGGTWQDRFAALGLKIPNSVKSGDSPTAKLLLGWQDQRRLGKLQTTDVTDIKKKYAGAWGLSDDEVEPALKSLIADGVVRYKNYSTGDRKKGADAIGLTGFFGAKTLQLTQGYEPKKVPKPKSDKKGGDEVDDKVQMTANPLYKTPEERSKEKLPERAKKSTYEDFQAFLNHGYAQLSTNVLHNYFCENGLTVLSESKEMPYKIYGDNAMLQKQSSEGVRFSAETSNMSRNAIYDFATKGETENSTAEIEDRLPKKVRDKDGNVATLADWHGEGGALKKLCWDKVFPSTAAFFSKSTFIASDTLVSASAREKVLKDVKILAESGESF